MEGALCYSNSDCSSSPHSSYEVWETMLGCSSEEFENDSSFCNNWLDFLLGRLAIICTYLDYFTANPDTYLFSKFSLGKEFDISSWICMKLLNFKFALFLLFNSFNSRLSNSSLIGFKRPNFSSFISTFLNFF